MDASTNTSLKVFLDDYLRSLGRKPSKGRGARGRRYAYQDLIGAANVSRTALYSWIAGAPASTDAIERLAIGLGKLAERAREEGNAIQRRNDDEILKNLRRILETPDVWAQFGAFKYPPLCGGQDSGWNFLGTVVEKYLRSSGRKHSDARLPEVTIDEVNKDIEERVLVGFFSMPDRMAEWDYIKTPVRVPLNALVLDRDLATAAKAGSSQSNDVDAAIDDILGGIRGWLWQTDPNRAHGNEIRPITARGEAGSSYVIQMHGFEESLLEADQVQSPVAQNFLEKLTDVSDSLRREKGRPRVPKIPVVIADELTCFRIMQDFASAPIASYTDLRLVSDPLSEIQDLSRAYRPTYSISLAVRRDRSPLSSFRLNSFEATRRSFEEFIRSNAAMIAHQYVHLYRELVASFDSKSLGLGVGTALYFLKWLSIPISPKEIADEGNLQETSHPTELSSPWHEVLGTAKAIILEDQDLREKLREAATLAEAPQRSTSP